MLWNSVVYYLFLCPISEVLSLNRDSIDGKTNNPKLLVNGTKNGWYF